MSGVPLLQVSYVEGHFLERKKCDSTDVAIERLDIRHEYDVIIISVFSVQSLFGECRNGAASAFVGLLAFYYRARVEAKMKARYLGKLA